MNPVGPWILLHAGHGGSEVPFQVVLWGLVGLLVVAGVIEYAGVFESSGDSTEDEAASGAGD